MAMAYASRYGVEQTRRFTIGVTLANAFLLSMSCVCQQVIILWIPSLAVWMKWLACLYMVYLSIMLLKDAGREGKNQVPSFPINTVFRGFILQMINPKLVLFCLTVTAGYLLPLAYNNYCVLAGYIGAMTLSAWGANTLWALFGAGIDRVLSGKRLWLDRCMAALVFLCAVEMAVVE